MAMSTLAPMAGQNIFIISILVRANPIRGSPPDAACFGFAGLWEHWTAPDGSVLETSSVLTTSPNELMATIHDRMPVILDPTDYQTWMQATPTDASALIRPFPAERMRAYAVNKAVGNVRNNSVELTAPIESIG